MLKRPSHYNQPEEPCGVMRNPLLTLGFVVAFLVLGAAPGSAQLATITFSDTSVGSTSSVTCPTTGVGVCFGGTNCESSGTIQSITGPNLPFAIDHFNLLTINQFSLGDCDANPVSRLPVTVGAGQVFAYQASFSPSASGSLTGSLTIATSGGPATFNLSGRGLPAPPTSAKRGLITVQTNKNDYVPGDLFELSYRTDPGTLQGNVDLYLAVQMPTGELLFLTEQGAFVTQFQPFRRNVTVVDETRTPMSFFIPVDLPFGTYSCFMAMATAGATLDPNNLQPSLVSAISQAVLSYGPLSPVQQSILQARGGNPDVVAIIWLPDLHQNRASWSYFSGTPTRYTFLNGNLEGPQVLSNTPTVAGPKLNPALLNPQTTLAQLTAAFGQPTNAAPNADAPEFQEVHYSLGLDVTFLDGRLSSATTSVP